MRRRFSANTVDLLPPIPDLAGGEAWRWYIGDAVMLLCALGSIVATWQRHALLALPFGVSMLARSAGIAEQLGFSRWGQYHYLITPIVSSCMR